MATWKKYLPAAVVMALGIFAGSVPALDIAEDVLHEDKTLLSAVIENFPLLFLSLAVFATGVWLLTSDWDRRYVQTVAKLSVLNFIGVALLISLVVFVQLQFQNDLKPFIIAADTVVIGTLGGLVLGLRTAQQQQAKDDAAAQRDRFQALFENVPNPIVGVEFVENVPIVRAVNPAFTEVFGFDRRTIVGESLEEYIVPPDESFDPVEQAMTAPGLDQAEAWDKNVINLQTVDGQREFIRLTAPVDRAPARDRYAIYIDITVQRQRKERLRVLSRTLRHDIRNHMNVIAGSADRLADTLDGENQTWASKIRDAAGDILRLSKQTRRVEKQIAGDSEPGPVNLTDILQETAAELRDMYDARITVEETTACYGQTTPAFAAAVEAVIENGIVHNDRDEPTVTISIVASLDGEYYDVRVADDGPGIEPGEVDVVTGNIEPTQTQHLDGLGLWTARWVMQNSGGELEFDANSPRGTIVTLRVPQATPPDSEPMPEANP